MIAAAVGVWISISDLRMKAEADQKTAEINLQTLQEKEEADRRTAEIALKSEDVKLRIAKEEFRQHREDANENMKKEQNASVSTAIDQMFASDRRSEGNLAVLYRFSSEDPSLRDLIVNAVVVRLSEPRSVGEIRLGLRLLDHIGLPALISLIEINRNARSSYNDVLFARFRSSLFAKLQQLGPSDKYLTGKEAEEFLSGLALRASSEVTDRAHIPARYVRATLFRLGDHQVGLCEYMLTQEHKELGAPLVIERLGVDRVMKDEVSNAEREELLAELMLQSQVLIAELVSNTLDKARPIDLSRTYLADLDWRSGQYPPLRLELAYVSGDSFDGVHFTGKAASLTGADRIELREGVITPSQKWPRFVEHMAKDWSQQDAELNRETRNRRTNEH